MSSPLPILTKNLHIYHHNDMDGISAAAILSMAYPTADKKFIESSYPIKININEYSLATNAKDITVLFLDLSFGEDELPILIKLSELVNRVIWIDHHEKSEKAVANNGEIWKHVRGTVDSSACGAMLTYQFLHNDKSREEIPNFIKVIDIYDRHVEGDLLTLGEYFNLAILSIPDLSPSHNIWKDLMTCGDPEADRLVGSGKIIYTYLQTYNKNFIEKYAVVTKILGVDAIAVNLPGSSILFDSVRDKFHLFLAWTFDGEQYKYTIYSDGSINCNSIATKYGGGGHPGAAGFSSEQLLFIPKEHKPYKS